MPQWVAEFLQGPTYIIGNAFWNQIMELIAGQLTMTPQHFSGAAWSYVQSLYRWSQSIAVVLLNLFFMIGFFRQASNLRENVTWEILIEYLIKAVMANGLMMSGLEIIQEFFSVASLLCGDLTVGDLPPFSTENLDFGSALFFSIFGAIYALVAIVCGFLILATVYGRYLKLYTMTVLAPVALSALAGGRGMEQTAYAWIKSFLVDVFEIVVIAMIMGIAGKMIASIDFGRSPGGIFEAADGFWSALQSMFTMILMASSVKGADTLLKRSFAL